MKKTAARKKRTKLSERLPAAVNRLLVSKVLEHRDQNSYLSEQLKLALRKLLWAREQLEDIASPKGSLDQAALLDFQRARCLTAADELRAFLGEPGRDVEQLARNTGLRVALGMEQLDVPGPTCHLGKG